MKQQETTNENNNDYPFITQTRLTNYPKVISNKISTTGNRYLIIKSEYLNIAINYGIGITQTNISYLNSIEVTLKKEKVQSKEYYHTTNIHLVDIKTETISVIEKAIFKLYEKTNENEYRLFSKNIAETITVKVYNSYTYF